MGDPDAHRSTTDLRGGSFQGVQIRHPDLSAADRELLAQKISRVEGVPCEQAHRQIAGLMSLDLN